MPNHQTIKKISLSEPVWSFYQTVEQQAQCLDSFRQDVI